MSSCYINISNVEFIGITTFKRCWIRRLKFDLYNVTKWNRKQKQPHISTIMSMTTLKPNKSKWKKEANRYMNWNVSANENAKIKSQPNNIGSEKEEKMQTNWWNEGFYATCDFGKLLQHWFAPEGRASLLSCCYRRVRNVTCWT